MFFCKIDSPLVFTCIRSQDINTRVSQYEENIPLKTVSIIGGMVSMTGLAIHIITTPIIRRYCLLGTVNNTMSPLD